MGGQRGRLEFLGQGTNVPLAEARVVVLPVPYEASVSYGRGTRRGPEAILRASSQVELYDEQSRSEPFRCGVWTEPLLRVPSTGPMDRSIARIGRRVGELLDAGKWVLTLGGEHSLTPGAVAAAAERYEGLVVVQFDAHADLRESYEDNRWSHACAMARCLDRAAELRAIGIRSYSVEEAERMRQGIPGYRIVHGWELEDDRRAEDALQGLDGRPVYLTFDVDYFDPAVVPATGTPEPGGGRWWPTLRLLTGLFQRANVVACDVVELAPDEGSQHAEFAVARLAYKLIGLKFG